MPAEGADHSAATGGFSLIETLLWQHRGGFFLLDLHIERLARSSAALGFECNMTNIETALHACVSRSQNTKLRVRLLLHRDGSIETRSQSLDDRSHNCKWRLAVSQQCLDRRDPLLPHKTTRRKLYDGELARMKHLTECDEVIFFNQDGELCEGSFTTIFLEMESRLVTPALCCGLLPGTLRAHLLTTGQAEEAVLDAQALHSAPRIYVGNSVRGLVPAELITS